jgi:hypothetical protein
VRCWVDARATRFAYVATCVPLRAPADLSRCVVTVLLTMTRFLL